MHRRTQPIAHTAALLAAVGVPALSVVASEPDSSVVSDEPDSALRLRPEHRTPPALVTSRLAPGVSAEGSEPVPVRLVLSGPEGEPLAWLDGVLPSTELARRAVSGEIGLTFALPETAPGMSQNLTLAPGLHFHAGRAAGFANAGIDHESAETGRVHGFVDAGGTRFDLYDISLRWDAFDPGPFTVTLLGGVRAIDAQTGVAPESADPLAAGDMRDVVAVPVVGGGLRWEVADGFYFAGSAATHTLDTSGTFIGLTAETGITLSPRVGVFAGYQYIRSALNVDSLADELSQEGVFARLEIRF